MDGNTSDKTTLKDFLVRIESMYGKAERVWGMNRGIPAEAVLQERRGSDPPVRYLAGTPRAKMRKMEQQWLELPWRKVRERGLVKLAAEGGEIQVLASSGGRQAKEMAMNSKKLARLLWKPRAIRRSCPARDPLLAGIGEARSAAGRAFGFVKTPLVFAGEEVTPETFTFREGKQKLRVCELVDCDYPRYSNQLAADPAVFWVRYIQLTRIEAAAKSMKSDLRIRPSFHQQRQQRVEAHILCCFRAIVWWRGKEPVGGLRARSDREGVVGKLVRIRMIDVCFPATGGRQLVMPR
ncbi:MAG: hypothetical protein ACK5TN_00605 [Acidobacteriota bacterium]